MPSYESHLRRALLAFTVATTIIAAGLGLCARAHAEDVSDVADGLLQRIAAAHPEYNIPEPPVIHTLAPSALRGRCGRGVSACAARELSGQAHVFVPDTDYTDAKARRILIHELLHTVQWANGRIPHAGNRFVLEHEARRAEALITE